MSLAGRPDAARMLRWAELGRETGDRYGDLGDDARERSPRPSTALSRFTKAYTAERGEATNPRW